MARTKATLGSGARLADYLTACERFSYPLKRAVQRKIAHREVVGQSRPNTQACFR